MITLEQAVAKVVEQTRTLPATTVPLSAARQFTLSQDIVSDVDSPPHDKALMDGYAVRTGDAATLPCELQVVEEITAGETPARKLEPGMAARIMTGAPIPPGADAVVMVEQTQTVPAPSDSIHPLGCVSIQATAVALGQNIMPRSAVMRRGETVLGRGTTLRPIEIGFLAELGIVDVPVFARPQVSVIATGDELVPAGRRPAPGQIRNSNGPLLQALVESAGGEVVGMGIAGDRRDVLESMVQDGLRHDLLLLSGGVSAGVKDLVPDVLQSLGVECMFHKVHLKPGKPVWFGVATAPEQHVLVFGLPGNPVSTLVCFELLVRPAILRMSGQSTSRRSLQQGRLAIEFAQRGDRPTYFPAVRQLQFPESPLLSPLPWRGSSDLRTLTRADSLVYFPPGPHDYAAGDSILFYPL